MDKTIMMDKLFGFLRGFPEFKNLTDMQYDEKYDLVRAKVGVVEKVIPIDDKSSWDAIESEVIACLRGGDYGAYTRIR